MIRAIIAVLALATALTLLAIGFGYLDYRKRMNSCLEAGGIVIKTGAGLKCVPKGEINLI